MLDHIAAKNFAKELKIDIFTIYREYLQLLFLKYFYNKDGSELVYFKGGTAIRFLLGSFRFSEDLDFTNLLSPSKLKKILNAATKDLKKETGDVYIKEQESPFDSSTYKIYQNLENYNFPLTIRLDFSSREKPFHPDTTFLETNFPIGPYPQVAFLKPAELLAEKIRAIMIRGKGRDIFDLWYLLTKKIEINWPLVNKKMLLYKRTVDLSELINVIKQMELKDIKSDLTRFLPLSHRKLVNNIKELSIRKMEEPKKP